MVNLNDLGNAFFEGGLAALISLNIKSLLRDKEVKGASLLPSIFVTLWGYWNMYYYPHLGQSLSFYCGCAVAAMNSAWLGLALHYKTNKAGHYRPKFTPTGEVVNVSFEAHGNLYVVDNHGTLYFIERTYAAPDTWLWYEQVRL